MTHIKVCLSERIKRTSSVESFRFMPEEKFAFIPGQAAKLIFDENNSSNKELNKYLSFSSSPSNNYLEFTKKLSDSEFSLRLRQLNPGSEILLEGPLGQCVFKDSYSKIAFLIGGIGITPVISIIEHIIGERLNTDILLFYSNRRQEDIAFKKELDYWQSITNNLKINYVVTDAEPQDKNCIFGCINRELLAAQAQDLTQRIIFIFGPPGMVKSMRDLSLELGCSSDNIKIEQFIGY